MHTMVIDATSGKTVAGIPGQRNAHGVAIVPEAGRGFISDGGGDGGIVVFNLKTNAILGHDRCDEGRSFAIRLAQLGKSALFLATSRLAVTRAEP
jgi:hypothetical protein